MRRKIWLRFCTLLSGLLASLGLLVLLLAALTVRERAYRFGDASPATGSTHLIIITPGMIGPHVVEGKVITGSLTVADRRTYTEGLTVRQGLTVTGDLTVTHGLTVGRGLDVNGALMVTGGLTVAVFGEQIVAPNRMITGGLVVTNGQTLIGGVTITGTLNVTGMGDLTVIGGLIVLGDVTVTGKLLVKPFHFYLPLISQNIVIQADNGGFESGPTMWHQFSTTGQTLILPASELGVLPYSGGWAASLGRVNNEVSMISQGVSIAKDTACLVYWQWTVSNDACNADYGGVGVNGRWVDVQSLCAGTSTARWVRQQVSMTHYSVEMTTTSVVLNFAVVNDYSVPSTMYVDDIAFYPTTFCAEFGSSTVHAVQASDATLTWMVGEPIATHRHASK